MRRLYLGIAIGLLMLAGERWFRGQAIACRATERGQVVQQLPPTRIGEHRAAATGYAAVSMVFFLLAYRDNPRRCESS